MRWYTIEWFGGFKTECEECGRYSVGDSIKEARNKLRAHLIDYFVPNCISCTHEMRAESKDDEDLSLSTRLRRAEAEVIKLRDSIGPWKEAWIHQRDVIGWLWWHHPAIDDDKQRAYYQSNLRAIEEIKRTEQPESQNVASTTRTGKQNGK